MKVNIISDGDITTVELLKQVFSRFGAVSSIDVMYINKLDASDLSESVNVFCRTCLPNYHWVAALMKDSRIPYIYYLDDNLWELKDGTPLAKYHSSPESQKTLNTFVENASLVITSTSRLVDYILENKKLAQKRVIQLPNFVDFSLFGEFRPKINPKNTVLDEPVRIGYAGSAKGKAFKPVLDALKQLRNENYNFELEFVGGVPEHSVLIDRQFEFRTSYIEYVELVKERNWDIGLAPFLDDYFWSFKTDNKYREYSALSIPCIFSNVKPFSESVVHGHNGFLAENNKNDWLKKIRDLLDNKYDLRAISKAAYSDVYNRYSLDIVAVKWSDALSIKKFHVESGYISFWFKINWSIRGTFNVNYYLFLVRTFLHTFRNEGFNSSLNKVIRYIKRNM